MKRSKNFEEAIKEVLAETNTVLKKTKKKKVVSEAIGPGNYMPAGLNVASQNPTRRSAGPPFSLYSDVGRGTPNPTEVQPDHELEAPPRAPYPLEFIMEYLADAYTSLKNVESNIRSSFINPVVTKAQNKELKKIQDNVKTILGNLRKISSEIQKISLD